MSLLVVKGNIVAALPMKEWYVCICILYTTHHPNHHHTVQVAKPTHVFVYISKWVVGIEKPPPVQVAGDDHHECK